jgi:molybdate transport system substrate-binding protein
MCAPRWRLCRPARLALGIVYQTDAAAEEGVKIVGTFPEDTHPPIIYPIGLTATTKNQDAADFEKCLQTEKAKELFEKEGFTFLAPVVSN